VTRDSRLAFSTLVGTLLRDACITPDGQLPQSSGNLSSPLKSEAVMTNIIDFKKARARLLLARMSPSLARLLLHICRDIDRKIQSARDLGIAVGEGIDPVLLSALEARVATSR
jgi:hypothetical protein